MRGTYSRVQHESIVVMGKKVCKKKGCQNIARTPLFVRFFLVSLIQRIKSRAAAAPLANL